VATGPSQLIKVAFWWQKSAEIPGKSGKELRVFTPKRGKTRKYKEETSDPGGITNSKRTPV